MTTTLETLKTLHRPRILMSAARFGLVDYNRAKSLARILGVDVTPRPATALDALLKCEAEVEEDRKNGSAAYSAARHIDLLIALLEEARLALRPKTGTPT